jgi:hypothetical protein
MLLKKYSDFGGGKKNNLIQSGKLTTYLFLKTNFKLEKYLTLVKKYEYRKSICKLRISAHRLFIVGREMIFSIPYR